jgi:hypothetical protein
MALLDAELASAIVWFDALMTNMDRTPRNTNMLIWHQKPWLIDHGAALYAQYGGAGFPSRARNPFPQIRDHILLPCANGLRATDERLSARLPEAVIQDIVALIPDSWLDDPSFARPEQQRSAYAEFLIERLRAPRGFVEEAIDARAQIV